METRTKIKNKIAWIALLVLLFIISFITGMNYRPVTVIQTQFDSITYKSKLDSLNEVIDSNKQIVNYLFAQKSKIKTKYVKIYAYLDSTTYDEILWEHGLLDDTTVLVSDSSIVLFRLVQGAEARAMNKIQDIEIKKLHAIISDMEEVRQNDSIAIAFLIQDNNKLNEAFIIQNKRISELMNDIQHIKTKKRSNGFKTAAFAFGGFIGGVFVGLIK